MPSPQFHAANRSLRATPEQVEGPYFLPASPWRNNLIPVGITGVIGRISGEVLSVEGDRIKGAVIHVWLADPDGVYDNQDAQGNPIALPVKQHKLRGRLKSNLAARYHFTYLRPGNYPDPKAVEELRPGHIHIKVEAPGYKTLTTQLYFIEDYFNEHDIPGDGFFQPELVVQMSPAMPVAGVVQKGIFNLILKKL